MNKKRSNRAEIRILIKQIYHMKPALIFLAIIEAILQTASLYVPLILLSSLLGALVTRRFDIFMLFGVGYFVSKEMLMVLSEWITGRRVILGREVNALLQKDLYMKPLKLSYEEVNQVGFMDKFHSALDELNYECDYYDIVEILQTLLKHILGIVTSAVLVITLLMKVPTASTGLLQVLATPWVSMVIVMVILVVTGFGSRRFLRRVNDKQRTFFATHGKIERRFAYFRDRVVYNFKHYGLFQMYDMIGVLSDSIHKSSDENVEFFGKQGKLGMHKTVTLSISSGIVTLCAYFITIVKVLANAVSIATILTYSQALVYLSESILGIIQEIEQLDRQLPYFKDLSSFMDLPEENSCGQEIPETTSELVWEFREVSYQYPGSESYAIDSLSVTLKLDGEHAIVGKNGSGKTTLIMLLCRLIKPTEGTIFLNGIDIGKLQAHSYWNVLSTVFQDFSLMPATLGENVAGSSDYNYEKVVRQLEMADFKVTANLETKVYYSGEDAQFFSGGESQKIAIARAFYKESRLLITDEPTAALDPISEAAIYQRIYQEIQDRGTIFITHRMSSCRMCSDIMVMDQGKVVARGTHEKLREDSPLYEKLWTSQANMYKS